MSSNPESFFSSSHPPANYNEILEQVRNFVDLQNKNGTRIALVTSGGTTVPLEKNTVRFIDNFSGGGRGSASAEYFIDAGYAVVFLTRKTSIQPFSRSLTKHGAHVFDSLTVESNSVQIIPELQASLMTSLTKYKQALKENKLKKIPFQSVSEYLFLLKGISEILNKSEKRALIFAAAAVSDFYIPENEMSEHKIQSSNNDGLTIKLHAVPKMLSLLREKWVPKAFIVSFKLETDANILKQKVEKSIQSGQNVVIGNLLQSYRDEVILFVKDKQDQLKITRSDSEIKADCDLELHLIPAIVKLHSEYLSE